MASATSLVLNIIGNNNATAALNAAGSSVSNLAGKVKKFGLIAAAGAATAAVGITAMAVDFTKAALEDEASASKLVQTMQKTQGATKEQIKSTEDWISKMGVATGVADDDLRPALASLMIAGRSTAQAQSDVAVAMDIAAAKGLDLGTVTNAMAKAAQGNTGALGKLGVATKDAEGNMLSYEEVLANATKTMGGASAAAADTTAGRFKRLSLVVSELKESIGYALLPVLTDLAGWFLDKGLPAMNALGDVITGFLGPAVAGLTAGFRNNDVTSLGLFGTFEKLGVQLRAVSTWVTGTLVPALQELWTWVQVHIVPAIVELYTQISSGLASAFDTIRNKIEENKPQLEQLWSWFVTLAGFITDYVVPVFATYLKTALQIAGIAIGAVIDGIGYLVDAINWLVPATQSAAGGVVAAWQWISDAAANTKQWVVDQFNAVVSFVQGIPQAIAQAMSNTAAFFTAPFIDAYYRIVGWVDKIMDKARSIASLGGTFGDGDAVSALGIDPSTGLPARANGGPVSKGSAYWVGERGAEVFVPKQDGEIIPTNKVADQFGGSPVAMSGGNGSSGGGRGEIHVHFHGPVAADAEAWVVSTIRKAVQSRGGNVSVLAG